MQIKRLAATFGRLENESLDLEPGLNVIEAPNEAGKSTWTALLRVMFYGLNTRDRSPGADKRRYQPWSGSAMNGAMDLSLPQGEVTITRRTARANSPMGAFSAVYTGTASPVDFLTAAGCGETLLGVPQDVYERSAYIRQSGLAVDQSAALERRIASLITTGEEDTSFTDAAGRLKKQLNARRHNKTGRIPQLEQAMAELRTAAEELDGLVQSVNRDLAEQDELQAQMEEIRGLMARHDGADLTDEYRTVESLRLDVASAHDRVKTLESGSRGLPDRLELETLQGRINALVSVDRAVAESKSRLELAVRAFRTAEAAMEAHPMAGKDPSQAASIPLNAPPRPKASPLFLVLALAAGLLTGGALAWFTRIWPAAAGGGLALFAAALLLLFIPLRRRQTEWDQDYAELARQRREAVDAYTELYDKAVQARTVCQGAQAAYEAVEATAKANLDQILSQVRAFRPMVRDLADARAAMDEAFVRCGELEQARRREDEARLRWQTRRDEAPPPPAEPVERPQESREELLRRQADTVDRLSALRRRIHTTQGRIQALGDPEDLRSQLRRMEEQYAFLHKEYDAIALATEVLFVASSSLQTRFSPDLGSRAAAIFTKLTKGKYNKVLLDQDLRPSAQETGQFVAHDVPFLSQGAADQLYLAVRLAICDMVLPADRACPVLLDDALVNFDDQRMAAALDYLLELSERRQVLLFTCQRREGEYLRWACPDRFHCVRLQG
ncbi:MAG: AAA family ATPase [Oscillospiraceae bacterium]|nr:AAA family ATPase [Oscillospiraceae bacterium]